MATPGLKTTDAIYLSDLEPTVSVQGYGQLTRDAEVDGGPIHVGKRYYSRGVGTHAPATIVYDIPEDVRRFEAVVGVDRAFAGLVRISVKVDGEIAFRSKRLSNVDDPIEVSIALEGAKRLTLQVDAMGSKKNDHVDWADARFLR